MAAVPHFGSITTEGGLLPAGFISRLVSETAEFPGTREEDYRLTPGTRLREVINRTWRDLLGAWQVFQPQIGRVAATDYSVTLTRDRWLLPLFSELGYGRLDRRDKPIAIDGKDYPISHQHDKALIHVVGWNVAIDRRTAGVTGAAKATPHSMVQELLNRTDDHVWAIVTNGRHLRLLRDNTSLTRAAYVEFDLETMFSEAIFDDFVALWLLAHATRIEGDPQTDCWLERWATESRQQGVRALESLGVGFQDAIEVFGQGFLAHPANATLRKRLRDGTLDKQDYYRQLLRIVYRLVFLLAAEDRDLLHPPETSAETRENYARYYSLSRIRELARRRRGTKHADLWQQVVVVARSLGGDTGQSTLGLPALGSGLWAEDGTADLDAARIQNTHLLAAMRSLAYTRREQALHRVDYRNLGSEELGSVYESLLELKPDLDPIAATFTLRRTSGNERRTTGSYYTTTSLISTLLDASLDKLLDEAAAKPDPEQAILDLKVIDPACGSGHFLVAAAHRIAKRLAVVRTGETNPTPNAARHALREVIGRCIFGIDLNPMAVELCKVSLWLEAIEPGKPLSFLDHHVICGNALLGATPRLLDAGLTDDAFTAIEGDDRPTVTARRKTNAYQRTHRNQRRLGITWNSDTLAAPIAAEIAAIELLPSDTRAQVAEQSSRYAQLQASNEGLRAKLSADAWCAAFVAVKTHDHSAITDDVIRALAYDPSGVPPEVRYEITELTSRYRFLHWHLAFPQVFKVDLTSGSESGCTGGFDLILGNPPWDTLSPDAKEFFAAHDPQIRFLKKENQLDLIADLTTDPQVASEWGRYRRDLFAAVHFIKNSGRYRLFAPGNLGKGDFNVYRFFVETGLAMTREGGWTAQITPSGLYNGANAAAIRRELFTHHRLALILGFINTGKRWFPGIHAETRFAMYAAQKSGPTVQFSAAFKIEDPAVLASGLAGLSEVPVETVRVQSPDALAISETSLGPDAAVTAKLYAAWPSFGTRIAGYPTHHYQAEVHMGMDRDLFGEEGLPLCEGRMIDQYDHRAKAYRSGRGRAAVWQPLEFGNPEKAIVAQWHVPRRNVPSKVGERIDRYRVAFCDVASPNTDRSFLAALVPPGVICGHSAPTFIYEKNADWAYLSFLAVANSFLVDFLIRKRVALHVSLSILDAIPVARIPIGHPLLDRLAPLVLRLTCTSLEMTDYWNAMAEYGWSVPVAEGTVPAAAAIDPKERDDVRAEIDAIVAKHVYGVAAEELAYVLDQFPVLEKRDRKAFGSYATKDRIMRRYAEV